MSKTKCGTVFIKSSDSALHPHNIYADQDIYDDPQDEVLDTKWFMSDTKNSTKRQKPIILTYKIKPTHKELLKMGYIKTSKATEIVSAGLFIIAICSLMLSIISGTHMIDPRLGIIFTFIATMFYWMAKVSDE